MHVWPCCKALATSFSLQPLLITHEDCLAAKHFISPKTSALCWPGGIVMTSKLQEVSQWIKENQLKSIGMLWGGGLAASIAYQWSQDIPRSLKIIHSRVYAQALTLGALACVAVAEHYDHKSTTSEEFHRHQKQLEDLQAALELKQAREHQQGASLGSKHLHHHQQSS